MTKLAPGYYQILIEAYCFPYKHQCYHTEHDYNANRYFINRLLVHGLIEDTFHSVDEKDARYTITERGRVLVEAMCDLPLPVQAWSMPK